MRGGFIFRRRGSSLKVHHGQCFTSMTKHGTGSMRSKRSMRRGFYFPQSEAALAGTSLVTVTVTVTVDRIPGPHHQCDSTKLPHGKTRGCNCRLHVIAPRPEHTIMIVPSAVTVTVTEYSLYIATGKRHCPSRRRPYITEYRCAGCTERTLFEWERQCHVSLP